MFIINVTINITITLNITNTITIDSTAITTITTGTITIVVTIISIAVYRRFIILWCDTSHYTTLILHDIALSHVDSYCKVP